MSSKKNEGIFNIFTTDRKGNNKKQDNTTNRKQK